MPGATTRTNTRATALSDEELRLMASLPGIEISVVEILKTLAAFVSESADRETRLNKRVDELSRQLKDVNEELVSLRESAISLRKATQGQFKHSRVRVRVNLRVGVPKQAVRVQQVLESMTPRCPVASPATFPVAVTSVKRMAASPATSPVAVTSVKRMATKMPSPPSPRQM